jgi:magnesium transporter
MLSVYTQQAGRVHNQVEVTHCKTLADAVWIDMVEPSKEEEQAVEAVLRIEVPTPEEMRGLESSSQIYREGDANVVTIRVVSSASTESPRVVAITFILTTARLVTLRYGQPSPFRVFAERLAKQPELLSSPQSAMLGLLEAIVESSKRNGMLRFLPAGNRRS